MISRCPKFQFHFLFLIVSASQSFAANSFMDEVISTIFSGFDSWLATAARTEISAFSVFTGEVASDIAPYVESLTKAYANASDEQQISSAYSVYSSEINGVIDGNVLSSLSYYYSIAGLITEEKPSTTITTTDINTSGHIVTDDSLFTSETLGSDLNSNLISDIMTVTQSQGENSTVYNSSFKDSTNYLIPTGFFQLPLLICLIFILL